jgi:site-specific DNA-cytosine methylase
MAQQKGPIEIPTFKQYRLDAASSIRTRRRHLAEGMLELTDIVSKLETSHSPQEIDCFLKECGLSDDEATTYMALASKLHGLAELLTSQTIGYDALRALSTAGDAAFSHALELVAAKGRLGAKELEKLRELPEAAQISDHERSLALRARALQDRCTTMATERLQEFEASTARLYSLMKRHRAWHQWMAENLRDIEEEEFLASHGEEGTRRELEPWPEIEAKGMRNMEARRKEIIPIADAVLKEFDEIFPDARVPVVEWAVVGNTDPLRRKFAESRHALELLAAGSFSQEFPWETSQYHHWDSFASIGFLAGVRQQEGSFRDLAPRPVTKLNAVIIGTASGAEGAGLDAAGFRVRGTYSSDELGAETIAINRRDWPVSDVALEEPGFADYVFEVAASAGRTVHLMMGSLRDEAFRERGGGEDDPREQFRSAFRVLKEVRPEAFCFECSPDFRDPRHTHFRNKLLSEAGEMRYSTADFVVLDANTYGVPQSRKRTMFFGVRGDRASEFRLPIISLPPKLTVGQSVFDVAFPLLREILQIPKVSRSIEQQNYRNWALTWFLSWGQKEVVPDTLGIVRNFRVASETWREEAGILIGTDEVVQPHANLSRFRKLPLTIPVLKRLQGIPDDWEFSGDYDEQVAQICQTTPPVMARMIGHSIHTALTGEIVDYDRAVRQPIDSKRWKGTKGGFKLGAESDNPRTIQAEEWKRHIQDQHAFSSEFEAAE